MPLVGTQAPDFEAKAVIGDDIVDYQMSSNWNAGKFTCLFFYPKDFTFVCPTEIIAFDAAMEEFAKRDCNVVACSTDQEFSHLAWNRQARNEGGLGGVRYPIVADTKKEISQAYDVLSPGGVAFRGLFVIDAKGVIRHMLVNDMPLGRNVQEAIRIVDAIRFTDEHGEVCPAGWTPGADTIDPNNANEYFAKAGSATVEVTA